MTGVDNDDDDEFGTATALQVMKEKIVKDCMIVSCDLLCSVNIQTMANFYRVNNASFVALLGDVVEQAAELPAPGQKGKFQPGNLNISCFFLFFSIDFNEFRFILERDLIGFDSKSNRIIYFNTHDDVDEIKIKYRVFQKYEF